MDIPTSIGADTSGTLVPKNLRWVAGVKPVVTPFARTPQCFQLGYVLAVRGQRNTFIVARQPHLVSVN